MRRFVTALGVLSLLATVVLAKAPHLVSYQGNLTDTGGSPLTGTYSLTFKVYHVPSGGVADWTETHASASVANGLFSVLLGSITPLTPQLFVDTNSWLGITVGADPEMTPRIRLASVPYSLRVSTVNTSTGGYITSGLQVQDSIQVVGPEGWIYMTANNSFDPTFRIVGTPGGAYISSNADGTRLNMSNDFTEGVIELHDNAGMGSLELFMNEIPGEVVLASTDGYSDAPSVTVAKDAVSVVLEAVTGDDAIRAPQGAINALEMQNEPGIASNVIANLDTLPPGGIEPVLSQSITIPADGYLVVEARSNMRFHGAAGYNEAFMQIDESDTGPFGQPYAVTAGSSSFPSTAEFWYPLYTSRTYFKSAGTYTFYLIGGQSASSAPLARAESRNSSMTIRYYPTSYGSVTAIASQPEAQAFERSALVSSGDGASAMFRVDLRELELKAAQAQAEAEKAKRQLMEARIKQFESVTAASSPPLGATE